jgi:hypothetical protein
MAFLRVQIFRINLLGVRIFEINRPRYLTGRSRYSTDTCED